MRCQSSDIYLPHTLLSKAQQRLPGWGLMGTYQNLPPAKCEQELPISCPVSSSFQPQKKHAKQGDGGTLTQLYFCQSHHRPSLPGAPLLAGGNCGPGCRLSAVWKAYQASFFHSDAQLHLLSGLSWPKRANGKILHWSSALPLASKV